MPAFRIPIKAQSGVLTIGGQDVTCHLRYVDIPEPTATTQDAGTWCDPTAAVQTPGQQTIDVEWVNSFSDGTDDGLADILTALADGQDKAWVFQPFGTGTDHPKFEWSSPVTVPYGRFQVDQPIIVGQTYAVTGLTYTKATSP